MARGITVDWVLIRVNTLVRIGAIAVACALGVGLAYVAYQLVNPAPDARARRAIARADRSHERVTVEPIPEQWLREIEVGKQQLDSAKNEYAAQEFDRAASLARGAHARFVALLGGGGEQQGVGHFSSIDGRVQVQRAGRADWETAEVQRPVSNGDFVRSGLDSTAEIIFVDGTLYRVGPNSLLEIHHQPQRVESPGEVKMVVGRINVYTSDSPSTVTTDSASTKIDSDSRVAVEHGEASRQTKVAAYAGSAEVSTRRGTRVLDSLEQLEADAEGRFSDTRQIPEPPQPMEPHNNASFNIAAQRFIELRWQRHSPAFAVHLQVSRSQRFPEDQRDVDADNLRKDRAKLEAMAPGTYFWRLATVAAAGLRSEWSPIRRFRISSPNRETLLQDRTPPVLTILPPQQLGHMFIVEGRTEVGATVTINGEPVEQDGQGNFRKTVEMGRNGWNELVIAAVDPSGNRAERRERVFVEVY